MPVTSASHRVIIIGDSCGQVERLVQAMLDSGRWEVVLISDMYPTTNTLPLMLRLYAPHAFCFAADNWPRALEARNELKQVNNQVPVIAFGENVSTESMLDVLRAGFLDYVSLAEAGTPNLNGVADRLVERLQDIPLRFGPMGKLFSFLPAKPGVGTSTVAFHTSEMLAKRTECDVLLADLDFNNGLIAFMAKMPASASPQDLFDRASTFDESIWEQIVQHRDHLHLFAPHAGESDLRIEPSKIEVVMAFARTLYPYVCVDLSGNMEKYATDMLRRSDRIFLVCTPETPALHVARARCRLLRELGLEDRITLIVNRWHRHSVFSLTDIENLLDIKVWETIPNEYGPVHHALMSGSCLDAKSKLGKSFSRIAGRLSGSEDQTSAASPLRICAPRPSSLMRLFRGNGVAAGDPAVDLDMVLQSVGESTELSSTPARELAARACSPTRLAG